MQRRVAFAGVVTIFLEIELNLIHQFDISGLSFATGSGRELGVKELCQLYVYNSIVRVKQSSVFEIRQKFLIFL